MPKYISSPVSSDYFQGRFYCQRIGDLQLAGKAKQTVYGYVRAVRKLAELGIKIKWVHMPVI